MRHILLGLTALLSCIAPVSAQSVNGDFDFRWKSDPSNTHRIMELLSPVSFTDKAGKVWSVPAGALVDGASIPPPLWSFAGSPFTGGYRRASVFHDHYCDIDTEKSSLVHTMFREAMEFDGVSSSESWLKYIAVKLYSATGGECGIEEGLLEFFNAADRIEGISLNNELFQKFEAIAAGKDPSSVEYRTDAIIAIASVENPRTLEAMTAFRRIPSDDNLNALDIAIRAEQPTQAELEGLIDVAKATVPEGSIALPSR